MMDLIDQKGCDYELLDSFLVFSNSVTHSPFAPDYITFLCKLTQNNKILTIFNIKEDVYLLNRVNLRIFSFSTLQFPELNFVMLTPETQLFSPMAGGNSGLVPTTAGQRTKKLNFII